MSALEPRLRIASNPSSPPPAAAFRTNRSSIRQSRIFEHFLGPPYKARLKTSSFSNKAGTWKLGIWAPFHRNRRLIDSQIVFHHGGTEDTEQPLMKHGSNTDSDPRLSMTHSVFISVFHPCSIRGSLFRCFVISSPRPPCLCGTFLLSFVIQSSRSDSTPPC